ncbi:MAG: response regulator transcription factor [Nitrospirota bacterium]
MATGHESILMVTTDDAFAQPLEKRLSQYNYTVTIARDTDGALDAARRALPVAVLVDRQPQTLAQLRREAGLRKVAIIALLPPSTDYPEEACLQDFERGADACLCTQGYPELVARIRAIIRRERLHAIGKPKYVVGAISLDVDRHEVSVGGKPVELTPKEFRLLQHFVQHPARVFSREELLNHVWGEGAALEYHTLDVHIHSLRQKIEPNPGEPRYIVTVRGIGYKLKSDS